VKSRTCRRLFDSVTHPAGALLLFSIVMLGWHLPGPFQLALRSDRWHVLEHGCFIAAGMFFWYPVVLPWPAAGRSARWALVPYLLIADAENSVLAAFLVFSGHLFYPVYDTVPRVNGIAAITDQIVAGAIMWVPGSILFLVPAVAIVMRGLEPARLMQPDAKPCAADVRPAAAIKHSAV
jgi:putative membrane protein